MIQVVIVVDRKVVFCTNFKPHKPAYLIRIAQPASPRQPKVEWIVTWEQAHELGNS